MLDRAMEAASVPRELFRSSEWHRGEGEHFALQLEQASCTNWRYWRFWRQKVSRRIGIGDIKWRSLYNIERIDGRRRLAKQSEWSIRLRMRGRMSSGKRQRKILKRIALVSN